MTIERGYITTNVHEHTLFIWNLAQGLVLKVPYFEASFYQMLVLKF